MNVKLLRQVQEQIRLHPEQFDIERWININTEGKDTDCGTTACIAGWACVLAHLKLNPKITFKQAAQCVDLEQDQLGWGLHQPGMKLLRITRSQALLLFYSSSWPEPYCSRHRELHAELKGEDLSPACRARVVRRLTKVAVERIEHFIETGGAQ